MTSLIFDFPDAGTGSPRRIVYRDPVRVLEARRVEEVRPVVAEIERAVSDGLHAAGFIAYEAAPAFEGRMSVRSGNRLPLLWFGLFDAPANLPEPSPSTSPTPTRAATPTPTPAALPGRWELEVDRPRYDAAVAAVREAIAEGRTYQVNLTARLRSELDGPEPDPVSVYESLRRAQGSGWHALLDLGREVIVSVSPELFFRTSGRRIETRPMKGTRPRGRWPEEDAALAAQLASSEKDRAENLMIVDLLRNDLGRVCETGSIRVPRLFDVERYRTVWQLTSTVEGRLREGAGLGDILGAVFPCGSVTGAPKISTMALIEELEVSPREVYCGAIGMVRPGGDMAFNVPIRTLWWDRQTGRAEYGTGGGIVWDSTPASEYDELRAKSAVIREPWPDFRLVETMAAAGGILVRRERHVERLRQSAEYFGFPFPEADVRAVLDTAAAADEGGTAPRRLRITIGPGGDIELDVAPLGTQGSPRPGASDGSPPLPVGLADRPVRSDDRFLFHKTTNRGTYDARRAHRPGAFDVLLWNERGEVTEFTRGNVVVELDGKRSTPPLQAGLLPGCLRAELLASGTIEERTVLVEDLTRAARVWFINSARGWLEVTLT
jgi:para-aminobenzoate synthetase / 4-amino-4-deoxychorismate lyase